MNLNNKISGRMKSQLKKMDRKLLAREVKIPEYIEEWNQKIKSEERLAAAAYLCIPGDIRPSDMLNADDVLYQNLDRKAFTWANKYSDLARKLLEKDGPDVPMWVLMVWGILNYEARLKAGVADFLPEGSDPLTWRDFTDEQPWARPPGHVKMLSPTKNYRKKPKSS